MIIFSYKKTMGKGKLTFNVQFNTIDCLPEFTKIKNQQNADHFSTAVFRAPRLQNCNLHKFRSIAAITQPGKSAFISVQMQLWSSYFSSTEIVLLVSFDCSFKETVVYNSKYNQTDYAPQINMIVMEYPMLFVFLDYKSNPYWAQKKSQRNHMKDINPKYIYFLIYNIKE